MIIRAVSRPSPFDSRETPPQNTLAPIRKVGRWQQWVLTYDITGPPVLTDFCRRGDPIDVFAARNSGSTTPECLCRQIEANRRKHGAAPWTPESTPKVALLRLFAMSSPEIERCCALQKVRVLFQHEASCGCMASICCDFTQDFPKHPPNPQTAWL